jgi:hypothetical protein
MPSVPLRAGGFGPSDGNHAQAADTDPVYSSQPPSWLCARRQTELAGNSSSCPKNAPELAGHVVPQRQTGATAD